MDNALYQNKPRTIDPYREWAGQTDYNTYFNYNKANAEIAEQNKQKEPAPIYQPAVDNTATKYNEFNSQINTQEAAKTPPPPPEQVWDEITSPFPEPKYDEARQQRLKNIAKANALGKGLSALGDIFSLSQGALVNRRENDGRIDRYNAMYQQYEDDYNRRMDQHNRDKINLYLQQLRENKADRRYQEEKDYRNRESEYRKEQDRINQEWREKESEKRSTEREQDNAVRQYQWEQEQKTRANSPYVAHELRMREIQERNDNALKQIEQRAKFNSNGGLELYSPSGETIYTLNKSELSKVFQMIRTDPATKDLAAQDISLMQSQFGQGITSTVMANVTAQYWDKVPAVKDFIDQRKTNTGQAGGSATPAVTPEVRDAIMSRNAPQLNPASQPTYTTNGAY